MLNQRIIIGSPGSGKSTLLKNYGNNIMIQNSNKDKWNTFEGYYSDHLKRLRQYLSSNESLIIDEPFFIIPPFLVPGLFNEFSKRNFTIATHRIGYFICLNPGIIFAKGFEISCTKLEEILILPPDDIFVLETKEFINFLNKFEDVCLDEEFLSKVLNHPIFKKHTSSYVVRDFIIYHLLCKNRGFTQNIEEYLGLLNNFFKEKNLNRTQNRIIKKIFPIS